MKFEITREWLASKLERCDDALVGAGGTSLEHFKKSVEERTVTPAVLAHIPSDLGKAVRFVREKKGWTRAELAELADIDESDLVFLETKINYDPTPRTVTQLADACNFSRAQFVQLAKHRLKLAANESALRFAAKSKSTDEVTDDEYEAIRILVETLLDHSRDDK